MTFRWVRGVAIGLAGDRRIAISSSEHGRTWIVRSDSLASAVDWLRVPALPMPDLAARMVEAGLLTSASDLRVEHGAWSPTARFHRWSGHEHYRDTPDAQPDAHRHAVGAPDGLEVDALKNLARPRGASRRLPRDLGDICWFATARMRLSRKIVLTPSDASVLFYSYGAAHDIYVIDGSTAKSTVAIADLDRRGHGVSKSARAQSVLESGGFGTTRRGLAVVGRMEDYQLRYRHEKAARGFFVDGGRILGEVVRAMAIWFGPVEVSPTPLGPPASRALGLDPATHVVVGMVCSVVPQRMPEELIPR